MIVYDADNELYVPPCPEGFRFLIECDPNTGSGSPYYVGCPVTAVLDARGMREAHRVPEDGPGPYFVFWDFDEPEPDEDPLVFYRKTYYVREQYGHSPETSWEDWLRKECYDVYDDAISYESAAIRSLRRRVEEFPSTPIRNETLYLWVCRVEDEVCRKIHVKQEVSVALSVVR